VINRIWHIDLATAQRLQAFERTPQRGVSGTNRKRSQKLVNEYAFEMLSKKMVDGKLVSRWGFSHQGFAFTGFIENGTAELKDGGHRIAALIQACTVGAKLGDDTLPPNPDFGFDVMVTEGLDEDSWLVMDLGKGRLPGDFLSSQGEVNTSVLGATIYLCYRYENGGGGVPYLKDHWIKSKLPPLVRKQYLEDNPGIREALQEGARLSRLLVPSAAASGFYLATKAGADKHELQVFMDDLRDGTGENWVKGNPVYTLREMLLNARNAHRHLRTEEQLALMIKTINAVLQGKKIENLSFKTRKSSTGAAAEVFPLVTP
jgi:hypothetical protein